MGDLELQALSSGQCIMVIPKTAATPTLLEIDILATCGPADFALDVDCPVTIAATPTSASGYVSSIAACVAHVTNHYIVHADGTTGGTPTVHAYVFTDANGATPVPVDGWMGHSGATYQIIDGIIVAFNNPC